MGSKSSSSVEEHSSAIQQRLKLCLGRIISLSIYPSQFLYLSVSLFLLLISATRQPEHSLTADGLLIYLSRHYTYILFHRTPHIHSLTHSCSRDRPECSVIQSSSLSTTFAEIIMHLLHRLNSQFLNKPHCSQQVLSSLYTNCMKKKWIMLFHNYLNHQFRFHAKQRNLKNIINIFVTKNKEYKYYRYHNSRKISRNAQNEGLMNMLLISPDPYISSFRRVRRKIDVIKIYLEEMINLLDV